MGNVDGLTNEIEVRGVQLSRTVLFDKQISRYAWELRNQADKGINNELFLVFDKIRIIEYVQDYVVYFARHRIFALSHSL